MWRLEERGGTASGMNFEQSKSAGTEAKTGWRKWLERVRHRKRVRSTIAWSLAFLTVIVASLLRGAIDPFLGDHHALTLYFAAVAVTSWYGGLGPGLLAMVLSWVAGDFFFITPRMQLNLPHEDLDEFVALVAFVFSSLAIAITSSMLRGALARANEKQRELEKEVAVRHEAEHALQLAQNQLRQHAAVLERRVQERTEHLRETIASLEGVCYHIAHDLRAPLRAMEGYTAILEKQFSPVLTSEGRGYLEHISEAANRMDLLIHGLLEYGRLGHDDFPIGRVESRPVVERVISRLGPEAERRGGRVSFGGYWPEINGNMFLLETVLLQLISNAIKFVPAGTAPHVLLDTEVSSERVKISVCDNGIGIPKEYHNKIFGIFQRLHSGSNEYPGTGIGLAITAKAVERMGGRLGVVSGKNGGSCFWCEFERPTEVPEGRMEIGKSNEKAAALI